jgi:hypothetical protein
MKFFFTHRFKLIVILFFFGFCSFSFSTKAQDPYKSLSVIGNSLIFNYNTLSQYNTGITLNSWTTVRIRFQYTGSNGWELRLFSNDDAIKYEGNPADDIALVDLIITPTVVSSNDFTTSPNVGFVLEEGPYDSLNPNQVVVSGDGGTTGTQVVVELTLTYDLGGMLNKPEGLYYASLYMLLVEK